MVNVLRIKRRLAGGAAGPPASLAAAELAMNEQDNILYYGRGNSGGAATSIVAIAGPGYIQPLDPTLTALAGLNATAGLLEQTGADAFTKRAMGVAAGTSIPTRADADARYMAAVPSPTDEHLARLDGATGLLLQSSPVAVTDAGNMSGIGTLSLTGKVTMTGGGQAETTAIAGGYINPNAASVQWTIESNTGVEGGIAVGGSVFLGAWSNHAITIRTNNVDRLAIDTAGALRLHNYSAGMLQTDASGNVSASPEAWTAFTPGINAGSGTFTSVATTGRYKQFGKTVFFQIEITITTNGTAAGYIAVNLPVLDRTAEMNQVIWGFLQSLSVPVCGNLSGQQAFIRKVDGSYPGGNGAIIVIGGVYEAA